MRMAPGGKSAAHTRASPQGVPLTPTTSPGCCCVQRVVSRLEAARLVPLDLPTVGSRRASERLAGIDPPAVLSVDPYRGRTRRMSPRATPPEHPSPDPIRLRADRAHARELGDDHDVAPSTAGRAGGPLASLAAAPSPRSVRHPPPCGRASCSALRAAIVRRSSSIPPSDRHTPERLTSTRVDTAAAVITPHPAAGPAPT